MAPVKFDDISKTAASVLNDDYQVSGYQFNAKQKTNFDGAIVTTAVDLFPGKEGVMTPAKLTWKLPKPMGIDHFAVDKLEMDKAGKFKLEMSSNKVGKGVLVDCKSDLADPAKITASCHYTALADTQVKVETKIMQPQDFTLEVTRAQGLAQFGFKCNQKNLTAPDVGLRLAKDAMFCSVLAKEGFSVFTAHGAYKVANGSMLAATYQHGGKQSGSWGLGCSHEVVKGTTVRAKVTQDQALHLGVKHAVSKGFTVVCGGKYDTATGSASYGLKLSVE
eukprot:TRINITY_DN2724_c0_g1_i2.p1 TRINITY_DN2724_c0_g1~~TRINITY_DN2724_c0_g1_i2.p1  ORF type:complete len:277 (+),score=94.35 TRINITY_DN2724_c0_g1_i2:98-928(+)